MNSRTLFNWGIFLHEKCLADDANNNLFEKKGSQKHISVKQIVGTLKKKISPWDIFLEPKFPLVRSCAVHWGSLRERSCLKPCLQRCVSVSLSCPVAWVGLSALELLQPTHFNCYVESAWRVNQAMAMPYTLRSETQLCEMSKPVIGCSISGSRSLCNKTERRVLGFQV